MQDGENKSNLTDSIFEKLTKLFKQPVFWLLGGAYFICGFTTAGVVKVHFIPYATSCGYTLATGAAATGVLAGFDMLRFGQVVDLRVNKTSIPNIVKGWEVQDLGS